MGKLDLRDVMERRAARPLGPGDEVVLRKEVRGRSTTPHDVATVCRVSASGLVTVRTADGRYVITGTHALMRVYGRCIECGAPLIHGPQSEDRTGLCTTCYVLALAEEG